MTGRQLTLYNTAKEALPRWLFQREQRAVSAMAAMFAVLWDQIDEWLDATYITRATGFWLDQHAVDRGTRRQLSEPDAALADRLRHPLDAVTPPALLARVQAVLSNQGVAGTAAIVELRNERVFVGVAGTSFGFASRGYRLGSSTVAGNELIVILPYGTTAATAAAVGEDLRQAKAAGVRVQIERRLNP